MITWVTAVRLALTFAALLLMCDALLVCDEPPGVFCKVLNVFLDGVLSVSILRHLCQAISQILNFKL